MTVTSPRNLLDKIDAARYERLIRPRRVPTAIMPSIESPKLQTAPPNTPSSTPAAAERSQPRASQLTRGLIQRFGANVDTDAIIPAEFMPGIDNTDLGRHCFEYFRPEFRRKAAAGATIVVAEHGFGSGSSREDAVRALLGAGIQCVIAKGFAFIYERNQLNMGLYSAVVADDDFYQLAQEGTALTIDKTAKTLTFDHGRSFTFSHSSIEDTLLEAGGVLPLYHLHGRALFREMIKPPPPPPHGIRSNSMQADTSTNPFRKDVSSIKAQLAW